MKNKILAGLAVFASRLGLLPANVSPLGSFGFFGHGLIYFATIIAFDFWVGGFYKGFWFTWAGFACYPLLGLIAKRLKLRYSLALLPLASLGFFVLSNFGSFWYWYPHDWSGLVWCYTLALPFYGYTLVGDLGFGYGYLAVKSWRRHYFNLLNFASRPL